MSKRTTVARLATNLKTSIIANYSLMNFSYLNRLSILFVISGSSWTDTESLPSDETLKQGRNLDHGRLGILCFSSNDTFVEKHFVDKIFVETFCRQTFVDKHFVDRAFRRQNISSTNFCRQAFRRQNTSSTGHFVDKSLSTEYFSSVKVVNSSSRFPPSPSFCMI
jgi:hypothetical protein